MLLVLLLLVVVYNYQLLLLFLHQLITELQLEVVEQVVLVLILERVVLIQRLLELLHLEEEQVEHLVLLV